MEPTTPDLHRPTASSQAWFYRFLVGLLLIGSAGLRVGYLATAASPLDLASDEAHYWDWSRQLDWSYYCKGPLVAYLIRGSCDLTGSLAREWTGDAMLSVRLPAVLCGTLLLLSLYVLTVQVFRKDGLALGVVAAALTVPLITAGSTLMTIDAPYTCCWGWALVFGYQAIFRNRTWAWVLVGLLVALGILAKYTMVLWVPSLGLFLLFTPGFRRRLLRPGFWIMAIVGALGSLPILYWNFQHGWVTFRHMQGHAGLQDAPGQLHWLGPFLFVGQQFAILLGYWFMVWLLAMWAYRPWRESRSDLSYLWWMSAPMFLFFLGFSLKNGGGEPNWPVTAYLSGLVLGAGWLVAQFRAPQLWYRLNARFWFILCCGLGAGLTLLIHHSELAYPLLARLAGPETAENPYPMRRLDPTCRLQGWRALALELDRMRKELADQGTEAVLAGDSWNYPGELSFYCQGQPAAYSLGPAVGERHSQYDIWRPNPVADPQAFLGRTFIVVGDPGRMRQAFDQLEPSRVVTHRVGGQTINQWILTVARGFRGFPALASSTRGY